MFIWNFKNIFVSFFVFIFGYVCDNCYINRKIFFWLMGLFDFVINVNIDFKWYVGVKIVRISVYFCIIEFI